MNKESPDAQVKTKNQLGTINGVFVPCLLNILGAVLFMRIGYSVGYAGESCTRLGSGPLLRHLWPLVTEVMAMAGQGLAKGWPLLTHCCATPTSLLFNW
jgi:hypothetical protein